MEKPVLVLLCDNYPLSAGEFFLDDEVRIIHPYFEKIIVLIKEQEKKELNRFISDNLEVITYSCDLRIREMIMAIPMIFTATFLRELFKAIFKFKVQNYLLLLKIMFMEIVRSNHLINEIEKLKLNRELILYSYWHDYKALAIARLSKKRRSISIARAHGWDVFADRHGLPYLPFKKFILENLYCTYSISEAGLLEMLNYTHYKEKIKVFRLGKLNSRIALFEKDNNGFLICSCGNIIPLKRIDKIIELLASLNNDAIKWVHFGDGFLRDEMLALAEKKLKAGSYVFKGIVSNSEILDFYAGNYIDMFINLSESEGIPVSIMEGLSAGIPVIATDVGGTREAVNNCNGFLVDKDINVENLVLIISDYLNSAAENQIKYRENAYKTWQENFDAEKNYTEFAEELISVVNSDFNKKRI